MPYSISQINDNTSLFSQVRITLQLGTSREKTFYVGQSLSDDIYHSLVIRRRGKNINVTIDDDEPLLGELFSLRMLSMNGLSNSLQNFGIIK